MKESQDYRKLFKGCSNAGAFRLRSQACRFRDELRARDHAAPLDEVQDALFELARDLLPASPGADFVTWAGFLCGDAMARLSEHYANLGPEEKEAVDLSRAWERERRSGGFKVNEDVARMGRVGPAPSLKTSLGVGLGASTAVETLVHSGVFRVAPLSCAGASLKTPQSP